MLQKYIFPSDVMGFRIFAYICAPIFAYETANIHIVIDVAKHPIFRPKHLH